MGCLNGIHHARGCTLSTSKSVRIVEESLLGFLHDVLLGGPQVDALVAASNRRLEELAREPEVDTAPLKADVRTLEAKIRKLVLLVENEPDEDLCRGYDRRIKELQKELNDRQAALRKAADRTRRPPVLLTKERAVAYLDDLRGTMAQEIPVAARAIRNVTGPIRIRQEPVPNREGEFRWIATFRPDLASALRAAVNGDGFSGPTIVPDVEVPGETVMPIEKIPRYERLAPLFKQQRDGGASIDSLAAAYGMTWKSAKEILVFADTGQRPEWTSGKRTGTKRRHEADYRRIAAQVVAMREDQRMSFEKIAEVLGVARNTARRAYDHLRPEAAIRAAEEGTRPRRGTYSHLGEEVFAEIRRRLRQGEKPADIAAQVGCGKSTVERVRQSLRSRQNADETGPSSDGTGSNSDTSPKS